MWTQVARRCYQLLLTHMTRFSYSPTGALKWKKDVSEYAEVLAGYGVPAADEDMAYLQQVRYWVCRAVLYSASAGDSRCAAGVVEA